MGLCLPGGPRVSVIQLVALTRVGLPGQAVVLDSAPDGVLVDGGVCLGGVVEPRRSGASLAAVIAVPVVHGAVVVIVSWDVDTHRLA